MSKSIFYRDTGVRRRLAQPVSRHLNGYAKKEHLAEDIYKRNINIVGQENQAERINSTDLTRFEGRFSTHISEKKISSIIDYFLENNNNFDCSVDIVECQTYSFSTDSQNYVVAARGNISQLDFASKLNIDLNDVKDAEKGKRIVESVFSAYLKHLQALGHNVILS